MFDYLNFPDPQLYLVGFVCFDTLVDDWTTTGPLTTETNSHSSAVRDFTMRTKVVTPAKTPLDHNEQIISLDTSNIPLIERPKFKLPLN